MCGVFTVSSQSLIAAQTRMPSCAHACARRATRAAQAGPRRVRLAPALNRRTPSAPMLEGSDQECGVQKIWRRVVRGEHTRQHSGRGPSHELFRDDRGQGRDDGRENAPRCRGGNHRIAPATALAARVPDVHLPSTGGRTPAMMRRGGCKGKHRATAMPPRGRRAHGRHIRQPRQRQQRGDRSASSNLECGTPHTLSRPCSHLKQ